MAKWKDYDFDFEDAPKTMVFTEKLWKVLQDLKAQADKAGRRNGVSALIWALYSLDMNPDIKNPMEIEEVCIGDKFKKPRKGNFLITIEGKQTYYPIDKFIRDFFGNKYSQMEVTNFIAAYDKIIGAEGQSAKLNLITPRPFKFEPKNVRDTFISLVTETYPMGHEEEVVPFITPGLSRDQYGNYYTVVGNNPDVSFTCHLDTASRTKSKVNLVAFKKDGDDFIGTDGTSILGADDKAGVAVCMYLLAHGVEGVYWFFMGEERGGIGSKKVAGDIESYPFMEKVTKMISFDRRNYHSVITQQMSGVCCSNEFAASLCKEFNSHGLKMNLDPTGVFTDSANFIDSVRECSNVSVGYFNEHTHDEIQNMTYLEKLCKACVKVDWSGLNVTRTVGMDEYLSRKYSRLKKSIDKSYFRNELDMFATEDQMLSENRD